MSKYTTEIRFICESFHNNEAGGYNSVDEIIQAAIPHVFSFDFPIFDPSYRNVLCTKILRHYYTREIGEETFGLWKLRLETKLNEIMPYYNTLYRSWEDNLDKLWGKQETTEYAGSKKGNDIGKEVTGENKSGSYEKTEDISRRGGEEAKTKTTQEGTGTKEQQESGTTNEDKQTVQQYSDTPQGGLDGILTHDYITNATVNDDHGVRKTQDSINITDKTDSTTETDFTDNKTEMEHKQDKGGDGYTINGTRDTDTQSTSTEDYLIKVIGYNGSEIGNNLALLKENLMNIDMMIIKELEVLFMNIW